jgi:hypothetical protein
MTVETIKCYRRECSADAGHRITLLCSQERDVCFDHLHDWILEVGCAWPELQHLQAYANWRAATELPPLDRDDLIAIVRIARQQSGYKFSDWEY